jgi:hypothetical protein
MRNAMTPVSISKILARWSRLPKSHLRPLLAVLLVLILQAPVAAQAGMILGKAAARGAVRSLERGAVYRRALGRVHLFRKPTRLERFTNRSLTDQRRGLPGHSFWTRPHPGRPGSAPHVKRKLNIPHPVKAREQVVVPGGTRYHERPIKGGQAHAREVILHKRVPGEAIKGGKALAGGSR